MGLLTNANKPKVALSPSRTLRVLHLRHLKENGVNIPDIGENKELFAQFRKYSSYTSGKWRTLLVHEWTSERMSKRSHSRQNLTFDVKIYAYNVAAWVESIKNRKNSFGILLMADIDKPVFCSVRVSNINFDEGQTGKNVKWQYDDSICKYVCIYWVSLFFYTVHFLISAFSRPVDFIGDQDVDKWTAMKNMRIMDIKSRRLHWTC